MKFRNHAEPVFAGIVITDYGQYTVGKKLSKCYEETFGKKRNGVLTKKSKQTAMNELSKDISAISRLCWLKGLDCIPIELLK